MNGRIHLVAAAAIGVLTLVAPVRTVFAQSIEPTEAAAAARQGLAIGLPAAGLPETALPVADPTTSGRQAGGALPDSVAGLFLIPPVSHSLQDHLTEDEFAVLQGRSKIAKSNMLMIGGGVTALIGLSVIGGNVGGIVALAGTGVAIYGLYLHFR